MREKLEVLADVAIVLFIAAVGAGYVKDSILERPKPISVGDSITPPLPLAVWQHNPQTLLIALKEGCVYCEVSAPFYRRLSSLRKEGRAKGVGILLLFPDAEPVALETLRSENLDLEFLSSVDYRKLRVAGTPTLILVDGNGKVSRVWMGLLSRAKEEELLNVLTGGHYQKEGP